MTYDFALFLLWTSLSSDVFIYLYMISTHKWERWRSLTHMLQTFWRRRTRRSWDQVLSGVPQPRCPRVRQPWGKRRPPAAPRIGTGAWHEPSALTRSLCHCPQTEKGSFRASTFRGDCFGGGYLVQITRAALTVRRPLTALHHFYLLNSNIFQGTAQVAEQ